MSRYNENLHKTELSRFRIECARKMTGRVLDVGGGLGEYLSYFNTSHVTVLDSDEETISRLNHDDKVVADAVHTPFLDNSFDCIWACAVAEYLDEPIEEFINEMKRICVQGGHIEILVPNGKSLWDRIKKIFGMQTWGDLENVKWLYCVDDLKKYGRVKGEIKFLPFESIFRNCPRMGHTLMLEIVNDKKK
ncbi:class I SAM-dependent methyltransferase [Butyrivibrio sp. CB08]|uniref:class I SAM-dependent methyltransferase n=1 Tax=Butyrivibrio sp. CB08 TaxID=2364879 RepID=UPI000EA97FD8|nr:class I SAM-dependent methyltransferase [Butyrivibrio sp. CB08]RKM57876.1 class I SAM-dependent methyltransferase [Butyrivibrio sp. CB08]